MTVKRRHETADPLVEETVDRLRRRVAWQVHAAYGVPLPPDPKPELPPEPELPPAAAPQPAAPVATQRLHRLPTIDELERIVAAAEARGRAGAEQWRWTVYYLREFTDAEGRLPQLFEPLVAPIYSEPV